MSRAKKSGDAYDMQKKQEARYDEVEKLGSPARLVEWINKVLGDTHAKCGASDWQTMQSHLKDGVALCKLINVLLLSNGQPKVGFKAKASQPFVAMGNIENFSKGAQAYGVMETSLFPTPDLVEGRKANFLNVVNALNQLGFAANSKNFTPKYEAPEAPKTDSDLCGPLD